NACVLVAEGANMPITAGGIDVLREGGVIIAPGKAANAGGVATSGLEMQQNAGFTSWSRDKVEHRLCQIMRRIHRSCLDTADEYGCEGDYIHGANISGFLRVSRAMLAQGLT
ncbi:MAG: glutamate dehydrogenase, partial [Rhodothermales bacterium]